MKKIIGNFLLLYIICIGIFFLSSCAGKKNIDWTSERIKERRVEAENEKKLIVEEFIMGEKKTPEGDSFSFMEADVASEQEEASLPFAEADVASEQEEASLPFAEADMASEQEEASLPFAEADVAGEQDTIETIEKKETEIKENDRETVTPIEAEDIKVEKTEPETIEPTKIEEEKSGEKFAENKTVVKKETAETLIEKKEIPGYIQTYKEGVNLLRFDLQNKRLLMIAKEKFKDVVEANEEYWPAYYNLAYIYYLNKEYAKAEEQIFNAMKYQESDNKEIMLLRATISLSKGEKDKAFDLFSKITEKYGNEAFAYFQLGNLLMLNKKYKKAITYFDRAGNPNKNFYYQFINKGTCYLSLKLYDEAIKTFRAVYELNIKDRYLLQQYAYSLSKKGNYSDAIRIYQELIELLPDEIAAYKNLGIIHELYLDKPKEAVRYYKLYVEREGRDKKNVENWMKISESKTRR